MDQTMINNLRSVQIELLKEFSRICIDNDINYWLDSGTLLGAVRHQGFIPWDDDIDVGMLRKDYDRFAEIIDDELDKDLYYYQNWLSESSYGQPFAKLLKKNTILVESSAEKTTSKSGVYIDIFPYDEYGNRQFTQGLPLKIIRRMILCKCGYQLWIYNDSFNLRKYLVYLPLRFISLFYSTRYLKERYEKIARKFNRTHQEKVFENGSTNYNKWAIDRDCFSSTVLLPFEGATYACPAGYDKYLKTVYGDYMKFPPIEQQNNKLSFKRLEFL